MRIALVGLGRMGTAVEAEAIARGHEIVARLGPDEMAALTPGPVSGVEVAIEFTLPESAFDNVRRLIELGVPTVSGTTGWTDRLAEVETLVRERGGSFLHAANFSIGAHLLFRAARELGRALANLPHVDAAIRERHHTRKKDAPSGTAAALREVLRSVDTVHEYPISSERLGGNPGEHELSIEAEYEAISLRHSARDRRVFAAGAVTAAEWLPGRRGFFRFEHVLFGDAP